MWPIKLTDELFPPLWALHKHGPCLRTRDYFQHRPIASQLRVVFEASEKGDYHDGMQIPASFLFSGIFLRGEESILE